MSAVAERPKTAARATASSKPRQPARLAPTTAPVAPVPTTWQSLIRERLHAIHESMVAAAFPGDGTEKNPTGLSADLVTDAANGLRELLLHGDISPEWNDTLSTLGQTLWIWHSVSAASALIETGYAHAGDLDPNDIVSARSGLAAVCWALEETDLEAMRTHLSRPVDERHYRWGKAPAEAVSAHKASPARDSNADRAYYRCREAEAVVRAAARESEDLKCQDALWGVANLAEAAAALMELGTNPTPANFQQASNLLSQAATVVELVADRTGEAIYLNDAASTLLQEAHRLVGEAQAEAPNV